MTKATVSSMESPYRRQKEKKRLLSPKSLLSEELSVTDSTTDRSMDHYGMMLPAHLMRTSESNASGVIPESEDESYSSTSIFSSSEVEESKGLASETETSDIDFVLHGHSSSKGRSKKHNSERDTRKERSRSDGLSKREGRSFNLLRRRSKAAETPPSSESSLQTRSLHIRDTSTSEDHPEQERSFHKSLTKFQRKKAPSGKQQDTKKKTSSRRQSRSKSAPEHPSKLLEKLSSTTKAFSSSSRVKDKATSSKRRQRSKENNHHKDGNAAAAAAAVPVDSETQMVLEQRKRERAARLEKVRERIRLQKEQSDAHKLEQTNRSRTTEERMTEAYQWYIRCGCPSRTVMKQRLCWDEQSCGLTVDDIDLLPWTKGGGRVSARKFLLLTSAVPRGKH